MLVSDLVIYDKDFNPLQLTLNDGIWTGEIYFKPISINLYQEAKLYILESNKYPSLLPTDELTFTWEGIEQQNFFIYDLVLDKETSTPTIDKYSSVIIGYESVLENTPIPLEINLAFSPTSELMYAKRLLIYLNEQLIGKILYYGEGVDEDERFQVHIDNAGIKFNSSDALALRKYDIKDAYPDWEVVNEGKKQLLLNKEQIFPYVGSYKALSKMCEVLGYKDVLKIKEYWKNIDKSSPYFNKLSLVDITDLLDDGKIDRMSLLTNNQDLKIDDSFKKCGFIALAYQFTKESGEYDSDGMPIVEKTTDFSSDEMHYKLNKLREILHESILPVNVVVKDIIGEWCYFVRFGLKTWRGLGTVTKTELGQDLKLSIYPSKTDLHVTEISSLFTSEVNYFQTIQFNTSGINVLANNQMHSYEDLGNVVKDLKDFTEYRRATTYEEIMNKYGTESSDDYEKKIGCPVVLNLDIPEIIASDIDGFCANNYKILIYPDPETKSVDIGVGSTSSEINVGSGINLEVGDWITVWNKDENTMESSSITEYTAGIAKLYTTLSINLSGNVKFWIDRYNHYTLENLKYKNAYEVEWTIEHQTRDFKWNRRLPIEYGQEIPLILPYTGKYNVKVCVHEFNGITSHKFERGFINVIEPNADVRACYRVTDQYDERYVPISEINADGTVNLLDRNVDGLDSEAINEDLIRLSFSKCGIYNPSVHSFRFSSFGNGDTIQLGTHPAYTFTSSNIADVVNALNKNEVNNSGIALFSYSYSGNVIKAVSKSLDERTKLDITYTGNVTGDSNTYSKIGQFEPYSISSHIKKNNLTFGDGRYVRGGDLLDASLMDLRDMNAYDFEFLGERLAGFKFSSCMNGDKIQIGLFPSFEITSSDVNVVIDALNASDNEGISMFNYYLSVDKSKIIASAKEYNRKAFQIVTYTGSVRGSRYTWNEPFFINRGTKMCLFEFSADGYGTLKIGDSDVVVKSGNSVYKVIVSGGVVADSQSSIINGNIELNIYLNGNGTLKIGNYDTMVYEVTDLTSFDEFLQNLNNIAYGGFIFTKIFDVINGEYYIKASKSNSVDNTVTCLNGINYGGFTFTKTSNGTIKGVKTGSDVYAVKCPSLINNTSVVGSNAVLDIYVNQYGVGSLKIGDYDSVTNEGKDVNKFDAFLAKLNYIAYGGFTFTKNIDSQSGEYYIKATKLGSSVYNVVVSGGVVADSQSSVVNGSAVLNISLNGAGTLKIGSYNVVVYDATDLTSFDAFLAKLNYIAYGGFTFTKVLDVTSKIYYITASKAGSAVYNVKASGSVVLKNNASIVGSEVMFEFSADKYVKLQVSGYGEVLCSASVSDFVTYLNDIRYAGFQFFETSYGKVRCYKSGSDVYSVLYTGDLSGHSATDKTGDECLLSLDIDFADIVNGEATQMQYYVDKWMVQYMSDGTMSGEMPVLHHSGYFDFDHCKYTPNTFVIPVFRYVFFTINNIHSKADCEFTLIDNLTKEVVVKVNNTPYLCYFFDERGVYDLQVTITDNNGNISTQYKEYFAIVQTFDEFAEYCKVRIENLDYWGC